MPFKNLTYSQGANINQAQALYDTYSIHVTADLKISGLQN